MMTSISGSMNVYSIADRVDSLAAAALIFGASDRDVAAILQRASAALDDFEAERCSEEDAALELEATDISIHALIDAQTSKENPR